MPSNKKKIVAKQADLIVGTATLVKNKQYNELLTSYVLPEFQNKGVGTLLWNEVRKFCDLKKDTIVHVATYNNQALNFYKKCGFVDTGKRLISNMWRMQNLSIDIPEIEMVIKADRQFG